MQQGKRWRGRSVAALALVAAIGARTAAAQGGELAWSYQSDGSWIADAVSLGEAGTQVFSEHGAYSNAVVLLSAHDADPPAPVWSNEASGLNFFRRVDSADHGGAHVALHQEYLPGSNSQRQALLRYYSAGSSIPAWSYTFPVVIPNHPYSHVRISEDGDRVVGVVYDMSLGKTFVASFDGSSSTPTATAWITTLGVYKGFDLSADGSTVALVSDLKVTLLDAVTLAETHAKYIFGQSVQGALGVSGDGGLVAVGVTSEAWIFERGATGPYTQTASVAYPAGTFCLELGVSADAGTLVLGLNAAGNPSLARVRAVDLPSRQVTMDHPLQGSGEYMNNVERVSVAADGSRFAVGLWGDELETLPEVLVFRRHQDGPVFTYDLPGSVTSLDLSPAGDRLAVGSKGGHASEIASGGAVWLFRTYARDIDLEGVPSIGATVELTHDVRPGDVVRFLSSPALAGQAQGFGPFGTLYLERLTLAGVGGPVVAGPDGVARKAMVLPDDPSLVGTSLYFQGLCLSPRELSEDWVKMTVLP